MTHTIVFVRDDGVNNGERSEFAVLMKGSTYVGLVRDF